MKAYLDGMPVAYPNESITNPTITLRRKDDTGEKAFSFTGDLIFTGSDFDYVYAQLVVSGNAINNKIVFTLENDCCVPPQNYNFYITHETIGEWCDGDCEITASAIENSLSADQLTCLKNTLIFDDYAGFQSMQHPRMTYCSELRPNWLHDVMILLLIATVSMVGVLAPVLAGIALLIGTVNAIITAINALPGINITLININGNTNFFAQFTQWINDAIALGVGCGRKHPSPLVRDYLTNVCTKCGLAFQSSIINNATSAYYNSVYVNAPVHKGIYESDNTTYWIDQNKPLRNGTQFLDELKSIFNADYKIEANTLTFERKDKFIPKAPWINITTYVDTKIISVCWQWSDKQRYSYANFEYTKDAINWVGGEAQKRWSDIVEWNIPYSNLQKGEYHPLIPFSPCRFRDDGIDRDVLTFYENFPYVGSIIRQNKRAMLLNSHTCYQPMLLIWDVSSGKKSASVEGASIYFPGVPSEGDDKYQQFVGVNEFFNYPYWFNANFPGNLYDQFWYIDNPKLTGFQGLDFTVDLIFDCNLLNIMDLDGTIQTAKGVGQITSIGLNFKTSVMTIKGSV